MRNKENYNNHMRDYMREYRQTEAYKSSRKKYRQSEAYKKYMRDYMRERNKTPEAKQYQHEYYLNKNKKTQVVLNLDLDIILKIDYIKSQYRMTRTEVLKILMYNNRLNIQKMYEHAQRIEKGLLSLDEFEDDIVC